MEKDGIAIVEIGPAGVERVTIQCRDGEGHIAGLEQLLDDIGNLDFLVRARQPPRRTRVRCAP